MDRLNPDLLVDVGIELMNELNDCLNQENASTQMQKINAFRLAGKETVQAVNRIISHATSARLRYLNVKNLFTLSVDLKYGEHVELPFIRGRDNYIFLSMLSQIKSLTLGNATVLPEEISNVLASSKDLDELKMERVVEFPDISHLNLKTLHCNFSAMQYISHIRAPLNLKSLHISGARPELIFESLKIQDNFNVEEVTAETFFLNANAIHILTQFQHPSVTKLHFITSEQADGLITDYLPSLLDNLLIAFPSLKELQLRIRTATRKTTDGTWLRSSQNVNTQFQLINEQIQRSIAEYPALQVNATYWVQGVVFLTSGTEADDFSQHFEKSDSGNDELLVWKTAVQTGNASLRVIIEIKKKTAAN